MKKKGSKSLTLKEMQRAKTLLALGNTYNAVAVEMGRDPKTIKKYAVDPYVAVEIIETKKQLADQFKELAERLLDSISDEDIQKINAYQRTVAAGIATDKMRLLREQSTENIDVHVQVQKLEQELREIERLEKIAE
ncbi:MAG: hypothetical protein JRD43_00470 [Deltaproteobacteria bacterium]|nr:hypothetical protein [Deltaproteobacteria bacterium]